MCINNVCVCLPDYQGDPYIGCRPECVMNTDCKKTQACIKQRCTDPCPNICGQNALCSTVNHIPICTCPTGMTGSAFISCSPPQGILYFSYWLISFNKFKNIHIKYIFLVSVVSKDPCNRSPCGSNSQCRNVNDQAVCSCVPGFLGSPPNCRPECILSSDCPLNQACSNQKCRDPCLGSCGINALCHVVNHNPICSCMEDLTGDPFTLCTPIRKYWNPTSNVNPFQLI